MKKIIQFIAVPCLLLVSCQNEKLTVVHKWKANSIKVNSTETINTNPSNTNVVYDFKSDGTIKMYSDAYPESGGGMGGTYTANSTNIVVTDSFNVLTYDIIGLSTNGLSIKTNFSGNLMEMAFDKL